MIVGYARLSEHEKPADLDAQRRALAAFGAEKVFTSAATPKGPHAARETALAFVREGDTLVVARPDRLARTPTELLRLACLGAADDGFAWDRRLGQRMQARTAAGGHQAGQAG